MRRLSHVRERGGLGELLVERPQPELLARARFHSRVHLAVGTVADEQHRQTGNDLRAVAKGVDVVLERGETLFSNALAVESDGSYVVLCVVSCIYG